jgi:hypothetical protein
LNIIREFDEFLDRGKMAADITDDVFHLAKKDEMG